MDQRSAVMVGLDVGDKHCYVCALDPVSGEVIEESRVRTTPTGIGRYFARWSRCRVTLEVGTHSPWISRALEEAGHEVIVANAREVRLIYGSSRKNDRLDAEKLARLTRYDVRLLAPIRHRSVQAQADLARVRSRDALVQTRTKLVSHVRGSVKAFGARIPSGSTAAFHTRAREHLPAELRAALEPVLDTIEGLTRTIREIECTLEEMASRDYPESEVLRQVDGVGLLTSLAFLLTLEDPNRFAKSREVGPYLGLTPGEHQSGSRDPKQRITKEGDTLLRRLLVQCAHQIIRSKSDSDLKRAAERILAKGDHRGKAVIAVARKLAVLLHHLWVTGEVYDPLFNHKTNPATRPAA